MTSIKKFLAVSPVLFSVMACQASGSMSSPDGPFPHREPVVPFSEFAAGRLGVIDSTFSPATQFAVWRNLTGHPLNTKESSQLAHVFFDKMTGPFIALSPEMSWSETRKRHAVPVEGGPRSYGDDYREYPPGPAGPKGHRQEFSNFLNCTTSATDTAAVTLEDRAKRYGEPLASPWVMDWVRAQDTVFSNCGGGATLPSAAPASAPVWLQKDRDYQIAAALFYSLQLDAAVKKFDEISKDNASPWQELSGYLAGRSLLRKGSLAKDPSERLKALTEAKHRFNDVRKNGTLRMKELALPMLSRVAIELSPQDAFNALEHRFSAANLDGVSTSDIQDFIVLLRKQAGDVTPQKGGLGDWLIEVGAASTIDPRREGLRPVTDDKRLSAVHACDLALLSLGTLQKAWTVACFMRAVDLKDIPRVVRARAETWASTDPAYPTVTYHNLRLERAGLDASATGRSPAAVALFRKNVDAALAIGARAFPVDALNALGVLRAPYASTVLEAFRNWEVTTITDARVVGTGVTLHRDGLVAISSDFPAAALLSLTEDQNQSAFVRSRAAELMWVRAALLGDIPKLEKLTPLIVHGQNSDMVKRIHDVMTAKTMAQRRYALARVFLRTGWYSVLAPNAEQRAEVLLRIARASGYGFWPGEGNAFIPVAPLFCATKTEQRELLAERDTLTTSLNYKGGVAEPKSLSTGNVFLANAVFDWAAENPRDSRLAQDLREVVYVGKETFSNGKFSPISQKAWTLLNKLFPDSPEAIKTKFYY